MIDNAEQSAVRLDWIDGQSRRWLVELRSDRIVLRSGDASVSFPADAWARDIYVIPHLERVMIRFETFERTVGFSLPADEAESFLEHLRRETDSAGAPAAEDSADPDDRRALMWPKVSPLAIWALSCSALVFVPVLGLLAAAATVFLLLLHRRRVRRAPAWNHSRKICAAAVVFLVAGLVVSSVATQGLSKNLRRARAAQLGISSLQPGASVAIGAPITRQYHGAVTHRAQKAQSSESILDRKHNWGLIAAGLLVVLFSLTVHEAAHATSAWWLGDDLARRTGRVTLSPLAHIDPIGTVLLPLILALSGAGVFGWARPVPVRAEVLSRPRRDHILISMAGPGSNLLLAAASMLLLLGLSCAMGLFAPGAVVENLTDLSFSTSVTVSGIALAGALGGILTILKLSFVINVFLAFFNLIPIPPLDGSWVLEHLFPRTLGRVYERIRPYGFMIFLMVLYTGLFQFLMLPALFAMLPGQVLLVWCTPF